MTPLLLLDVDGVLNALADEGENEVVWPQWRRGRAQADGVSWRTSTNFRLTLTANAYGRLSADGAEWPVAV